MYSMGLPGESSPQTSPASLRAGMSAGSVFLLLIAESVCLLELVVLSMGPLVRVMCLPVLVEITMAVDTLVMVLDLTVVTSERLTL